MIYHRLSVSTGRPRLYEIVFPLLIPLPVCLHKHLNFLSPSWGKGVRSCSKKKNFILLSLTSTEWSHPNDLETLFAFCIFRERKMQDEFNVWRGMQLLLRKGRWIQRDRRDHGAHSSFSNHTAVNSAKSGFPDLHGVTLTSVLWPCLVFVAQSLCVACFKLWIGCWG